MFAFVLMIVTSCSQYGCGILTFLLYSRQGNGEVERGKSKGLCQLVIVFFLCLFPLSKVEALSEALPSSLGLTFHWPALCHGYPYLEDGWGEGNASGDWLTEWTVPDTLPFTHIHPSTWNALYIISHVPFVHIICTCCQPSPVPSEGLWAALCIFL